jgi:CBS domain-containing protein
MSRQVVYTIEADETLESAAGKMHQQEIGSLAVLRDGGFAGIITERDIVRAVSEGVESARTPVASYMNDDPIVASPGDGTREMAAHMVVMGVRHLPLVVDGEAVGMVSIRDLLEQIALSEHDDPDPGRII